MPKRSKRKVAPAGEPQLLKGWKQIAEFLGEPPTVVKRWATEGMPVTEQGRFVVTSPEQLNAWLGRESGKPVGPEPYVEATLADVDSFHE